MSEAHGAVSITRWTLMRVFWRSFFLQATSNYERMQNVGFCFCLSPVLRKLYQGSALKDALARHLVFFNSHPYMTAALLGATIRIEIQVASGERSVDDVINFKRYMMGPMAAIGDSFFWASLRPFAAAWAVMAVLSGLIWAPIAFLLLFNLCHLGIRCYGLMYGYREGEKVCERIHKLSLVKIADRTHYLAALFLGATAAIFTDRAMGSKFHLSDGVEPFLLFSMMLIFLLALKRGISMVGLLYASSFGTAGLIIFLNSLFPIL
ncbi:MAG: PTS system mannose/fructose/sorbose family transporter subunit IID [Bradymonadia bacterium]